MSRSYFRAAHAEIAEARRVAENGADAYWEWVARKHRWMKPWDTVRTGELGDFRYFDGGLINVADNCVDRWPRTRRPPAPPR